MNKISTASTNQNQVEQHSLGKSIILHLLPAVIWIIFYIPCNRIAAKKGIPPMLVMLTIGILTLLAFQLIYLYYQGKKKNGTLSLKGVVLYRQKMPWQQYLLWGVIIVAWLMLVFLGGSQIVDFFRTKLFSWIPDWYYLSKGSVEQNGPAIEITMAVLSVLFFGLIGPIVEEIYFRGYLLPRLAKFGKWAPLLNVVFFTLYHLWQPHYWGIMIIALLPWFYIVWWKKNIYLSIMVHCSTNLLGSIVDAIQRLG